MTQQETRKNLLEVALLFLLMLFLMPTFNQYWDIELFKSWALQIHRNGFASVYHADCNYPPGFLYCLYFYNLVQGSEEKIISNINSLKIFPLLFDFLPVVFLLSYKKLTGIKKEYLWFLLFNFVYFYNSLIWGQVDSIHSCLCIIAVIVAFDYPIVAAAVFVVALNTKLQSVIFLPLLAFILATKIKGAKNILMMAATAILVQVIILLPFLLSANVQDVFHVVFHAVDYYPKVSLNAFNFWYLVASTTPFELSDKEQWIFLSYKNAGLLLFFIFSTVILLPVFIRTLKVVFGKDALTDKDKELAFLTGGLITICFFFFNTQMHERYAHPAFIFFFFYALYSKNFSLYIITTVAYFLNVERLLCYLPIAHGTALFDVRFVALLYSLILFIGIYKLYKPRCNGEMWSWKNS